MADQLPSEAKVYMMIMHMLGGRAVAALVHFGVPDKVQEGPRSVDDIASELNVDAGSLFRLIRCVSRMGLINIDDNRIVSLAEGGKCLLSNPGDGCASMRAALLMFTAPGHALPWSDFEYAVRTGKPSTEATLGKSMWQHLAENPEEEKLFSRAMGGVSIMFLRAVLEAYQFPEAACIVDVGGAHGAMLKGILDAYPNATGVLFDIPSVVESADVSAYDGRITKFGGNFIEGPVPQVEADVYVMKHILHDWSDDECVTILRNIRNAIRKPTAKLIVLEMLVEDPKPGMPIDATCVMDLNMMVLCTGRERTVQEFSAIFKQAGFYLNNVVRTKSPGFVLECGIVEPPN